MDRAGDRDTLGLKTLGRFKLKFEACFPLASVIILESSMLNVGS